ncbi:MAG: TolC family protein [Lautropia sp.]|nr:TolC family protein [Lautropia sp.]
MALRAPILSSLPSRRAPGTGLSARTRGLTSLAVALACLSLHAGIRAETLPEVIGTALTLHPQVLGARRNAEAIRHEVTGAANGMNTRFGVIAEPVASWQRGEGRNRSGGDFGVQALKPIYDGGRTDNETDRQRARLDGANYATEASRDDIALQVADAYIEVVKQQELRALASEYVDGIAALRERVQDIVRIDKGRGYDLLQTQSRLSQAQLTLADREGQLAEAREALAQLVGKPVNSVVESAPPGAPIRTLEDAMALLNEHPAVRARQAEVNAARKAAAVADAWTKPTVNVRARVTSPRDIEGRRQWFGSYDLGLVTDWSPFDGGVGAAQAAAANAQILTAEENVAATRRQLQTQVARHWTQIQSRVGRVGTRAELVERTRKVRSAYWEQFQIGKRSIIDLLNAENEIYAARLGAASEQQELNQARYRLLGATGQLLPRLGIQPLPPVTDQPPATEQNNGIPALPELR